MFRRQQVPYTLRRGDAVVEDQNATGCAINRSLPVAKPKRVGSRARAEFIRQHLEANESLDATEQRNIVDWLGQEIIGARFEPPHPVLRLIERGDHDDGNVLGGRVTLDTTTDLDAINTRHHHVEQHDVRTGALHRFQRICAVHRGDNLEILCRELGFEQANIGENVIDDKDASRHCDFFK